jgi:OmpA-OmpF porin, OOP family
MKNLQSVVPMLIAVAFMTGCATAPPAPLKTPAAPITIATESPAPVRCNDGDKDGICDGEDHCPMQTGPAETFGCPIDPCNGSPLLVLVQFEYDSSIMPTPKAGSEPPMDPVLDEVAEAIAQDSSCRVCIVGHASEEGTGEYNEELSQKRASAVHEYLTVHNVAGSQIPFTGMGERCQLVPEKSLALNRRVEFHRLQQGESCPTECTVPTKDEL